MLPSILQNRLTTEKIIAFDYELNLHLRAFKNLHDAVHFGAKSASQKIFQLGWIHHLEGLGHSIDILALICDW